MSDVKPAASTANLREMYRSETEKGPDVGRAAGEVKAGLVSGGLKAAAEDEASDTAAPAAPADRFASAVNGQNMGGRQQTSISSQGILPMGAESAGAASDGGSAGFQGVSASYQNILKTGGDVSKISADDFQNLSAQFSSFSPAEQTAVKQALNRLVPGTPDKPGSAGGDALQYASDGLKGGDKDAAKNRLNDLKNFNSA